MGTLLSMSVGTNGSCVLSIDLSKLNACKPKLLYAIQEVVMGVREARKEDCESQVRRIIGPRAVVRSRPPRRWMSERSVPSLPL
jgi:hypothetical protein